MSTALGIVRREVVTRDAQFRFRGAGERQRRAAASECKGSIIGRGRKSTGKARAQWMRRAGLGDAPRTLVEEFARIKSGDVVLPTVRRDGQPGRTVRVRCVTTPDREQKVLLHRLGVNLPERLRYLEEITPM
jgi:hypothetical protein